MKTGQCGCKAVVHDTKLIVLTGGPGAGKTAALEIARKYFCSHVTIVPEAASVIFTGGFGRHGRIAELKAAQRAIFHVQRELEQIVLDEKQMALALCDRGTLDGEAYWPEGQGLFWSGLHTTREAELKRYAAVIHLHTPPLENGYNHSNPARIETAQEAANIDKKIVAAWEGHPRRFFIESTSNFIEKVARAVELVKNELPPCCRQHET